jgi:hypothetical protein
MRKHRRTMLALVPLIVLVLIAAGCSGSEDADGGGDTEDGQGAEPAGGGDDALALSGVCPDPIVVLTSWFNQVEHFAPFQVLGDEYEPNADVKSVTGPLVASGGVDTGVDIEIRAGGPAIGFELVSAQMYLDESITLGMLATDEVVRSAAAQPVTAVMAPFDRDPLVIMWSPEVHPEWNTIVDIGQTDETVLYFEGESPYMDYLLGAGILRESQVDGSYEGTPDRFVAEGGSIAMQGFATSEPWRLANETEPWNRPMDFQYVQDTGYPSYRNVLAVRSGEVGELAPCLEKLVPILQQATADFMEDPDPVVEKILSIVDETEQGYVDSVERSEHAVEVMRTDGLVGNGEDDTLGNFEMTRIEELLEIVVPIYTGQDIEVPGDLNAEDVATNEFIDDSIGLAAG